MGKYVLDAPYYDGKVVVNSNNVKAAVYTNGGVTLKLAEGGSVRVVDNQSTKRCTDAANVSR